MLKKKILSLVAGSLLFLANSCSATNLISMGPVSLIVPADTVTNDLITPKFDTDSIQVDKAAHTVDVLIFITPSLIIIMMNTALNALSCLKMLLRVLPMYCV